MPNELEELHLALDGLFPEEERQNLILACIKDPLDVTLKMAHFGLDIGLMYAHQYGIPPEIKEMCSDRDRPEEVPAKIQQPDLSRLPVPSLQNLGLERYPAKPAVHNKFSLKGLGGSRKTKTSKEV